MKNAQSSKRRHKLVLNSTVAITASALSASVLAGTSGNTSGTLPLQGTYTYNGNTYRVPAATISFAGQTALKAFNGGPGLTTLTPGRSITLTFVQPNPTTGAPLLDGLGNPITTSVTYRAQADNTNNILDTYVQLASNNFTASDSWLDASANPVTDVGNSIVNRSQASIQTDSALRVEWHQEGSLTGLLDAINDQIGYVGTPISLAGARGPSTANTTIINTNTNDGGSSSSASKGLPISGDFINTYNASVYNQKTGINFSGGPINNNVASGLSNTSSGQDRVQFAVGEYKTEGLAPTGTAASSPLLPASSSAKNSTIFSIATGYGQGNPALTAPANNVPGIGVNSSRQQFRSVTIANQSTDKVDPQTGQNYAAGPWNTAGTDNIDSKAFAVTAVGFSANPGTGLQRLDRGNAQWLQTTSRLSNGGVYNFSSRVADTGQRIVTAINTGVDPTWAVGANDGGDTTGTLNNLQAQIGPNIRYSGKTSGSEVAATIGSNRLAVGALSISEATGAAASRPVRNLDVDFHSQTTTLAAANNTASDGTSLAGDGSYFTRINFDTITGNDPTTGSAYSQSTLDAKRWKATLISHFNTIKSPNAAFAGDSAAQWAARSTFTPNSDTTDGANVLGNDSTVTGIKGDPFNNVASVLSNVLVSVGTSTVAVTSNNPADSLFNNGYLTPSLLDWNRITDGGDINYTPASGSALAEQQSVRSTFGTKFTAELGNSAAQNATTTGVNGAGKYGSLTSTAIPGGAIAITAFNTSGTSASNGTFTKYGNWLFGNFNQTGTRDFASVLESVDAAISLHAVDSASGNSLFGGLANNTVIVPVLNGAAGWYTPIPSTSVRPAASKGDLITLGDANSDGKFDGKDVYILAKGSSLSDNPAAGGASATGLTSASGVDLADQLRNPYAKLNKNAALQNIQLQTSPTGGANDPDRAWLRTSGQTTFIVAGSTPPTTPPTYAGLAASATGGSYTNPNLSVNPTVAITGYYYTWDPTGANTFNERDVNRDGLVNLNDAFVADKFAGKSYANLTDQTSATIGADGTILSSIAQQSINLTDVAQVDSAATVSTVPTIGQGDLNNIAQGVSVATATKGVSLGLDGVQRFQWYNSGTTTVNGVSYGGTTKAGSLNITASPAAGSVFLVPASTVFNIVGGRFTARGAVDPFTDNTGSATNGNHLSIVNNSTGTDGLLGTTNSPIGLEISAGSKAIGTLEGTGATQVDATATLIADHIRQGGALVLSGTAAIRPQASHTVATIAAGVSVVGSLSITPTGQLDLANNDLVVKNASVGSVSNQISAGFNGGTWTGNGIVSSLAVGDSLHAFGVAAPVSTISFDGQTATSSDVIVKYTYYGDADLSGTVTGNDYTLIDNAFNTATGSGWSNGDFNYDGKIDGSDYTLIDNAFNRQGPSLAGSAASIVALTASEVTSKGTAVPEPSAFGILGICTVGMMRRRRRN